MSHKCSVEDRSGDFAGHERVVILQVILDSTCSMGSCIVVSKDECLPMSTGVGHSNRLYYIVCVLEPSDISLTDVEFCPPSHDDPLPSPLQTMILQPP